MAKGIITVRISAEGDPTISVKGVKGKSCTTLTKALEDAYGKADKRQHTKEYAEREQQQERSQNA